MRVTFSKDVPELGQRIKTARQACGKTATELAAAAGISVPHWNRIENEKVKDLSIDKLRAIESALGVDLDVEF
jgi:transcriptional regulator with XRE-family HTH domain